MAAMKGHLGVVDYLMFGTMLLISAGIGVYFRFSGGKQKTSEEYLLAGKNMSVLPVAFSLMASFLSAITIVGIPAEMYNFGILLLYLYITKFIGIILSAYITLPVFFELQVSTAYEYIERRFGKFARTIISLVFVAQMILYMSVVLYAPALALSAVTNLSTWTAIISVGVVCTFYCTLGGMKAVLWTDVFQTLLMFTGLCAVLIKGFIDVGFYDVFRIADERGRIIVPNFDISFYPRYTMWNLLIHGIIMTMSSFGANQVQIQRLLTVKSLFRARKSMFYGFILMTAFFILNGISGLVIFSYFADCDPLTAPDKPIQKSDQLLPYFMVASLSEYPGLSGLCICGIFSASLSTISSAVNSLTAVTMQDLVEPFLKAKEMAQKNSTIIAQVITLFYGFLCVALTFLIANFGNVIQAAIIVFGMLGSPVLGVFLLGMLTVRTNEKGAVIGLLLGLAISAWMSFGSSANAPHPKTLPVSTAGCEASNSTLKESVFIFNTTSLPINLDIDKYEEPKLHTSINRNATEINKEDLFFLYRISFMWYATISLIVTCITGYIASIILNRINGETKDVGPELLSPVVKCFFQKKNKDPPVGANVELQAVTQNNGVTK